MRVLALDQGTSATKAVVFEEDGALVSSAEAAVAPVAVVGGGVEQDPEQLWASVCQAGREAIARAGGGVGAIGFANQGETVLAWDRRTGRPLGAAVSWQDRRAATVCADLADHASQLTAITGLPLDPYFAAPKMTWLRQHGTSDGVVTTSDSWLLHRLTGAYVTDVTTASRTMLLDLRTRTWSEDACALFGLGVSDLPAVVGCAEGIGQTDAFGPSVPVTGLSVDQQAALIGEHCLEAGDSKCTYGTGAFLLANAGAQPFTSSAGLAVSVAWQVGDLAAYCIDGQVYAAGAAIAWLVRWGFLAKPEELDAVASSVPDAGGVTVVPALTGLGAPWWEPDALGAVEGIGPATQPAHVVRATVEGLAAQVAVLARAAAADLGRPLTRLRVDGGLTNSRLLMQTQADLLGVPLEVASSAHATAAGVGAMARLGADPGRTLEGVVGRTESPTSYEPTMPADEAAERLARFERAVALRVDAARWHGTVSDSRSYDVAIIGAGVVGTAIGRQLARYRLRTVILDRAVDVGTGTSKANTAILHTGFDTEPGSLESSLVRRGHQLLGAYARAAGIAQEETGAVLVAWDAEQAARLDDVLSKAQANGYQRATRLALDELRRREPHLGDGATGAVVIPDESIICPWSTSIAFATEAVRAGVELRLGTTVTGVARDHETSGWVVQTDQGAVRTDWVVNAAGLFSDRVNRWFGHDEFTVAPRRGQLIVFDKLARTLVSSIVLPVPTQRTKGVLVAPTVYGNVLLGPTAEDIDDPEDTATTGPGLEGLMGAGHRIVPELVGEEVTAAYAGVRAATEHRDYQIAVDEEQHYACVGGIRSTGLTASLAIAEYVTDQMGAAGLALVEATEEPVIPRMPELGERALRAFADADKVRGDPAYGHIVCFCERVTEGEVTDALTATVPAVDVGGVRRRTRATNGRCQGFFCGAAIAARVASR